MMNSKDILKLLSPILIIAMIIFFNYLGNRHKKMSIENERKVSIIGVIDSIYRIRGDGWYSARVKTSKGYKVCPLGFFMYENIMRKEVSVGDSIIKDSNTLHIWIIKSNGIKTKFTSIES